MSTIVQTFTGDISNLQRCYQSIGKDVVRLEQQMQRYASAAKESNSAAVAGMNRQSTATQSMIGQVASLATQWLSVGTAVRLATDAMQHQFSIQDRALTLQRSLARQQWDLAGSLADSTPEQFAKSNAQLQDMQMRTGFPSQGHAVKAYGRALNVTGGREDIARAATEKALRVSRANPESAEVMAGGIASIMHHLQVDADTAFGNLGLQQTEGALRDLGIAAAIQPRISAAVANHPNADPREEGLFYHKLNAVIQNQVGDATGERTSTTGENLSRKLTEYFAPPERDKDGKVTWRFGGLTDPNAPHIPGRPVKKYRPKDPEKYVSSQQQIDYLTENPKEARAFVENLGGPGEAAAALRSLILPNEIETMRRKREEAIKAGVPEAQLPLPPVIDRMKQSKIGFGDAALQANKNLMKNLESGTPALATENRIAQQQAAQERRMIQDAYKAKRAEARQLIEDTFKNLDSLSPIGQAMLYSQKLGTNLLSGGQSAQATRKLLESAEYYATSEGDKESLADAKKRLEEIVGPRPKNLLLQQHGISRLTSPEEMRNLRDEILKNNGAKSVDELRPFYQDAYRELGGRIQEQEGEAGIANFQDRAGEEKKKYQDAETQRTMLDQKIERLRGLNGGGLPQRRARAQQIESLLRERDALPETGKDGKPAITDQSSIQKSFLRPVRGGFNQMPNMADFVNHPMVQRPRNFQGDNGINQPLPSGFGGAAKDDPQMNEQNQLLVRLIHVNEQVLSTLNTLGNRPAVPTPAAANNQRGVHGER